MERHDSLDRLDPTERRTAIAAVRRAATLTRRLDRIHERHAERVARIEAERSERWREAVALGVSRREAAKAAGLHHSAVDRALG
jgi:hypothetical protein